MQKNFNITSSMSTENFCDKTRCSPRMPRNVSRESYDVRYFIFPTPNPNGVLSVRRVMKLNSLARRVVKRDSPNYSAEGRCRFQASVLRAKHNNRCMAVCSSSSSGTTRVCPRSGWGLNPGSPSRMRRERASANPRNPPSCQRRDRWRGNRKYRSRSRPSGLGRKETARNRQCSIRPYGPACSGCLRPKKEEIDFE